MTGVQKTVVGMPLDRDWAFELWLKDEVARTYDEVMADPDRIVTAETFRERLHLRHLERRGVNGR